jgi:hypothetical protein
MTSMTSPSGLRNAGHCGSPPVHSDVQCGQKIPAWWHPCFDEATNKSVNLAVWKKVCGPENLRAGFSTLDQLLA